MMAFSNHRIPLPITNALAGIYDRRSLIDRDLIRDPSTSTIGAITFPPLLLAAQCAVQITACLFILIDMLVDPFMTDRLAMFVL